MLSLQVNSLPSDYCWILDSGTTCLNDLASDSGISLANYQTDNTTNWVAINSKVIPLACPDGQFINKTTTTGGTCATPAVASGDGNNYTLAFGASGTSTKNWSLYRDGMSTLTGTWSDYDTDTDDQTCAEVSGCVVGALTLANYQTDNTSTWTAINSKGISNFTLTQYQTDNTTNWIAINSKLSLANYQTDNTSTWSKINTLLNLSNFQIQNTSLWTSINSKGISNFTLTQYQTDNTSTWSKINTLLNLSNFQIQNTSLWTSINSKGISNFTLTQYQTDNTSTWSAINGKFSAAGGKVSGNINVTGYNVTASCIYWGTNNTMC